MNSHHWPKPSSLGDLICLLGGILLPLAFAPYSWRLVALVSIALLFWQMQITRDLPRALLRGFLFCLGFFGFGAHWIYYSLLNYGNLPLWAALIGTLLFILVLASFGLIIGVLFHYTRRSLLWDALATFPAIWVLTEWLRGWIFSGFPWLFLGYSQTSGSLSGFAPVIGTLGISYLLVLAACCIVLIASSKLKHPTLFASVIFAIWACGLALQRENWIEYDAKPIKVSLVQGNIPFQEKWSQTQTEKNLDKYAELTKPHLDSQLIVWPENAIAMPFAFATDFLNMMKEQAKAHKSTIISGIPIGNNQDQYTNSLISIGENSGQYQKRRLVPFAESIPLSFIVDPLLTRFNIPHAQLIQGDSNQGNLRFGDYQIAPFICYEVAFSSTVLSNLPAANLLLTISDDAWFGHSVAAPQHLQIAQMRALESQRYHLFTGNRGITALIAPNGHIVTSAEPFKTAVVSGNVLMGHGSTPWIFFGDWPILLLAFVILSIAAIMQSLSPQQVSQASLYA